MTHSEHDSVTLQKQLDVLLKFPDQNPNPVLKASTSGALMYANEGGRMIQDAWAIRVGDAIPDAIINHARAESRSPLELDVANKTFAFHIVQVPEFDFINIYGTDVTAMKAIAKFPDQNPNPVLKASLTGALMYVNAGGQAILEAWEVGLGDQVPGEILAHEAEETHAPLELAVGHKTFAFHIVRVPQFDFINIYGTDVTAMKAIAKFPDQNPNPVLKTSLDGELLYANEGGKDIQEAWSLAVGDAVPESIIEHARSHSTLPLEMEVAGKTYLFQIVSVPEFGFVNIYGTDVTAARDNEQILRKLAKYFSPQVYESIFTGDLEVKIETRRKRLTVFFSDIKGFTEITERLEPEVLTELITEYLTEMTNIAVAHGGTVDKYIGDAIMVFFGDPKSRGHKEDALACIRMSIAMRDGLHGLRRSWQNRGVSQPLNIRIGVHTDTCTVGNFGSHDRLDYTTIGNGVNLASRLESNANTNQILISEDTYLLIRDSIDCKKLEQIRVKNIAHPIQTYEVVGELGAGTGLPNVAEHEEGFSLVIDPNKIQDVDKKRVLLQQALSMLDKLE
jgi:class 3 adenylate cyclase